MEGKNTPNKCIECKDSICIGFDIYCNNKLVVENLEMSIQDRATPGIDIPFWCPLARAQRDDFVGYIFG